jgi:hypothetical protein
MKRSRAKAVGLGLALIAGSLVAGAVAAADGDWHAPGQPPAAVEANPGAPALLPPALRAAPPNPDTGPIWIPVQSSAVQQPAVAPASGAAPAPVLSAVPALPAPPTPPPQTQSPPQPGPIQWASASETAVGPRAATGDASQIPAIPVLPDATAPSAAQPPAQLNAPVAQPVPLPLPQPANQPMPQRPRVSDDLPQPNMGEPPAGSPLPFPRPVDQSPAPLEPQPGLQPAALQPPPSDQACPPGTTAPLKMAPFGAPPIRLNSDFPPMRDLIQQGQMHDDLTIDGRSDGSAARFFVSGEYLLWWVPGFAVPVLATTNSNTALNGYLGQPGTTAIIGPGSLNDSTRSGLRVRAGMWFDDCESCGIDGSFFFLPRTSETTVVNSAQFPIITRPVYVPNPIPGTSTPIGENGESVAVPGILRGSVTATATSELWGADLNLRKTLFTSCDWTAIVFAGYRYLNLTEDLTMTENITVVGPGGSRISIPDPIGTRVVVQDEFRTHNDFDGGQVGFLYERRLGRWDFDARGSVALGDTYQILDIDGYQVRERPGEAPMTYRGGLLAAGPNLGQFTSNHFSVVPELTLNVGYRVTDNFRVFAGYNFLVWTDVIRPGDQIDRTVDLTFVPNAPAVPFSGQFRPRPLFAQRDLVVNGIQFGAELRW